MDEKTKSSLWTSGAQEQNTHIFEIYSLGRKEFINELTGFENTVSVGGCYFCCILEEEVKCTRKPVKVLETKQADKILL